MASNADHQRRYRQRNVVTLTAPAKTIAAKLLAMTDQAKLKKIVAMLTTQLKRGTASHERQ